MGWKNGMQFVHQLDGSVLYWRQKVKSVSATSLLGRTLSLQMAAAEMLLCIGVSEHIRPSTCQKCKPKCAHLEFCVCERSEMTGQNDVIYVSQKDLYRGAGKEMKSTVRRMWWSRYVDH